MDIIRKYVRKVLYEEIGRNYHTIRTEPNMWDTFQDFEINYYPQGDGTYLMDIAFKGEQTAPTSRFGSQDEAKHHARMIVDKYRVEYMNATSQDVS